MSSSQPKLLNIDRRIIFVVIFLAILIPLILPKDLENKATSDVRNIYEKVEEVGAKKGKILVSFDFNPGAKAELEPMVRAFLKHAFSKDITVIGMTNWPTGATYAQGILQDVAKSCAKEEGRDWTWLGYKPGTGILILSMGQDFPGAFPTDANGKSVKTLESTKSILTLKDFDFVMSFSAGSGGIDEWVIYGQTKFGISLGGGCTGVMAPDFFPYLQTKQLAGLVAALGGAAQYEQLLIDAKIEHKGKAIAQMFPQSIAHIVIIIFVILGNLVYFLGQRPSAKKEGSA